MATRGRARAEAALDTPSWGFCEADRRTLWRPASQIDARGWAVLSPLPGNSRSVRQHQSAAKGCPENPCWKNSVVDFRDFSCRLALLQPEQGQRLLGALHPYSAGGAYSNFMMTEGEEGQDRVRATYGENYARLVEVKTKYDPENFFRVNQNIRPAR
jgi:hypothetical protein